MIHLIVVYCVKKFKKDLNQIILKRLSFYILMKKSEHLFFLENSLFRIKKFLLKKIKQ